MTTPFPPAGTSQAALLLARFTANLRQGMAQPLNDAIFREFTGELISSQFIAETDLCPAYYFAKNRDQAVLVVDGCRRMSQARSLFAAYLPTLGIPSLDPRNSFIEQAANGIANYFKGLGFPGFNHVFLGGWSLGGAIAQNVPRLCQTPELRTVNWSCDTFGAPRSGGNSIATAIATYGANARWMNENDPIPLVPPRPLDFVGLPLVAGAAGAIEFSRYVHGPGGRSMAANGEITPSVLPRTASSSFLASLATWYFQWDAGNEPDHAIGTYVTRLERSEAFYTHTQGRANNRVEPPANAPVQQVQRHEAVVAQAIVNLERQQGMDPVDVPVQRLFVARRIGRVWMVLLGESVVSMPGSRRAARSLARHGNEFLRSLQNKAFVSKDGLNGALADYLALASSPDGGFRPVMNTNLPQVPV